jgi:HTH-type transcriptional regulator/antitoxin HigA
MKIKPIRNYSDYTEAKKELETIIKSDIDSEDGQKAEILSILVENYEKKMTLEEGIDMEPLVDYIYDLVKSTSDVVGDKSDQNGIIKRGLKLSEESGELAAEILKLVDYKSHNLTKDQIKQNMLLESVDCLIMVFDIMTHVGFTKKEIVNMAENQVNKWLNNIKNK